MHSSGPSISVVVASFNRAQTLQRCIDSVLKQTYGNRELLVVDGQSTDGSIELLQRYGSAVAWSAGPDKGLYDAFNKALRRARGQWIYFLGADDYLLDDTVFERMAQHLADAYPPYRVVYAQAHFVSQRGEVLETLGQPWEAFREKFLQGYMLPHQAVFHHRSLFEAHGQFDDSFLNGGDYDMMLRELKDRDALFVPGIVVAAYQFGGGSSTPANTLHILKMIRRAQIRNGVRPGLLWMKAVVRALIRVALWKVLGERNAKRLLDWGRARLGKPAFWTRV
jgi:glycosyltransferase involved in cell wall biosynthesis